MKISKKILVLFGVLFTVSFATVFLYFPAKSQSFEFALPFPEVKDALSKQNSLLGVVKSRKTTDSYPPNAFFPTSTSPKLTNAPQVTARSYAAMDRNTHELLVAKNLTQELPIASLTKMMTALVALENARLDKEHTVSQKAAALGEATMGLSVGERMNTEELLYGMLLPSGNDAALTLAEGVGSSHDWFLTRMNEKAESLGLYDTYFFNPTGLDEESVAKSSFSTALDLLALTDYALSNETFAKIVSTKSYHVEVKPDYHKEFYLDNILNFDRAYPGIKGVKTGLSDFAHETLVSYAEYNGHRIILVLLGSEATRDDAVKLYDFVFKTGS